MGDEDNFDEVTKHAGKALYELGVGDKFPIPVEQVIQYAGLSMSPSLTVTPHELARLGPKASGSTRALSKVLGIVDLREDTVYVSQRVLPVKQKFITLHEAGHKLLPWQRATYLFLDDNTTLDPQVSELFEREANRFAADLLFGIDRFDIESQALPWGIESPKALATQYGTSIQAAIRRYAERNPEPCMLLSLDRVERRGSGALELTVKRVVTSPSFRRLYGLPNLPKFIPPTWLVYQLVTEGRKFVKGFEMVIPIGNGNTVPLLCDFFDNSYNPVVLMKPLGRSNRP